MALNGTNTSFILTCCISLMLAACGGGSDSSGSSVGSDEGTRNCPTSVTNTPDDTLVALNDIEEEVNDYRANSAKIIQTFNNDQLLNEPQTRHVDFEDDLTVELARLEAEVIAGIETILTGQELRCLSPGLYNYLFDDHKDGLVSIVNAEIDNIITTATVQSITKATSLESILEHYCAISNSLEASGFLIPGDLSLSSSEKQQANPINSCD